MQLEKDGRVFVTSNEDLIKAYKEAGWTEKKAPAKTSKK